MAYAVEQERKKILNFATGGSVYPKGYTTKGSLALKEELSGEELHTDDIDFGMRNPERAFLEAEEALYPDKALARKVAGRWLERPMYNQERAILSSQARRKLAQPKYLENGKLNQNYVNLEEKNETTDRILNSYGRKGLERIRNIQKFVQIRENKRKYLAPEIREEDPKKFQKELAPCLGPIRVLQELENLRRIRQTFFQKKAYGEKEDSELIKETALDLACAEFLNT